MPVKARLRCGTRRLKRSQVYPILYGRKVCKMHLKHMVARLQLQYIQWCQARCVTLGIFGVIGAPLDPWADHLPLCHQAEHPSMPRDSLFTENKELGTLKELIDKVQRSWGAALCESQWLAWLDPTSVCGSAMQCHGQYVLKDRVVWPGYNNFNQILNHILIYLNKRIITVTC